MKIKQALSNGKSFGDAFAGSAIIKQQFKHQIATGETGGKLDVTLKKLSQLAEGDLQFRLAAFNELFGRFVSAVTSCVVAA